MTEGGNGRGVRADGPLRLPRCEVFRKLQIDRGSSRCSVDGRRGTPRIRRSTARCPRRAASGPEAPGAFHVRGPRGSRVGRGSLRRFWTATAPCAAPTADSRPTRRWRGWDRRARRSASGVNARLSERTPGPVGSSGGLEGPAFPTRAGSEVSRRSDGVARSGARGALSRSVESASPGPVRRLVRRRVRGSRREAIRVRRRVRGPPRLGHLQLPIILVMLHQTYPIAARGALSPSAANRHAEVAPWRIDAGSVPLG